MPVSSSTGTGRNTASTSLPPAMVRMRNSVEHRRTDGGPGPAPRHGASRRWCSAWSRVSLASRKGQTVNPPRARSGQDDPGTNGLGIVEAKDRRLPIGTKPQRALEPAEVPVGLGRRADDVRE